MILPPKVTHPTFPPKTRRIFTQVKAMADGIVAVACARSQYNVKAY
jgi:hypothetical protein